MQVRSGVSAEAVVDLYEEFSRQPSSSSSMTLFGESAVATYRALCAGVTAEQIASAVRRRLERMPATSGHGSGVMYRTPLAVTFHAATGQALATVPGDLVGTRLTPRTLQTLIAFGFQNGLTGETRRLIEGAASMQSLVDALAAQKQQREQRGRVSRQRTSPPTEAASSLSRLLATALRALQAIDVVKPEDVTAMQALLELRRELARLTPVR